jgi:hypothetical protein
MPVIITTNTQVRTLGHRTIGGAHQAEKKNEDKRDAMAGIRRLFLVEFNKEFSSQYTIPKTLDNEIKADLGRITTLARTDSHAMLNTIVALAILMLPKNCMIDLP